MATKRTKKTAKKASKKVTKRRRTKTAAKARKAKAPDTSDTSSKSNVATRNGDWKPTFLQALRDSANIRASADIAGVARSTVYEHQQNDSEFADAMANAIEDAVDSLELRARDRAMEQSDVLMKFLLQAHRPNKYAQHLKLGGDGSAIGLEHKLSLGDMMRKLRRREEAAADEARDVTPADEH